MDHFPLWYRRAAEHPPGSFIYSIVSEDDSGNLSLNTRGEKRKFFPYSFQCHAYPNPFIATLAQWELLRSSLMAFGIPCVKAEGQNHQTHSQV